jgi:hypothetical protein
MGHKGQMVHFMQKIINYFSAVSFDQSELKLRYESIAKYYSLGKLFKKIQKQLF